MRYRLTVLMILLLLVMLLFAMLPTMNLLAAPAPEPNAILDISTLPWWRKTAEQHLKFEIEFATSSHTLDTVLSYPEVRKLPPVAAMKDARPWLAKHLRVKPEKGDRLLHFTFRAGKRIEKVTIINAFLRASLHWHDIDGKAIQFFEEAIRRAENQILDLERRIESGQYPPHMVDFYREGIHDTRDTQIPALRAEIARRKQYAVIRWAR